MAREYTYTRYSPVTDDSWIGTPKKNSASSSNTGNIGNVTGNSTASTGNKGTSAGTPQISDGSWILPGKNTGAVNTTTKPVKNGTTGNISGNVKGTTGNNTSGNTGNIPLNSAPSNPTGGNVSNNSNNSQITYIPVSTTVPAGYTTPNGTLITNLPGTYTPPAPTVNYPTLTSFTSSGGITYNNTTGQFSDALVFSGGITRVGNTISLSPGANGEVLSMSGGLPVWLTPAAVSVPVTTVFGRTGSIIGQAGDYTTSLIAE